MPTLSPYLTFEGNCREAMNFYHEILGGELTFMVVGESPVASQVPPNMQHLILHSSLKAESFEIMASDMTPTKVILGNDVHLGLIFKDEEETRRQFDRLAEGGKVLQPLHAMFFGLIGTLTDKFGKNWLLECDKPA